MARLTELQRNYIKAQLSAPFATPTEWCRMAGYSDKHHKAAAVQALRLKHDVRLEEAAHEYAAHMMHRDGPVLAVSVMMRIARNDKHPRQLQAAEAIADRIGLHRLSEHKIMVEHTSSEAMVARIKELAAKLGMDAEKLLGGNMRDVTPKQIEGKAEAVTGLPPREKP